MSHAKEGSLRKCLSKIVKFKWQEKLQLLKKIILGLKVIHESGLAHCDLHDGNILISDNFNESFIIDLGLCRPISNLQDSDNEDKIYGVLPFMAPEVLRKKPYTPASDIYSFSMIMWEFTSGIPPFNNKAHDFQLSLSICKGERPEIMKNTPKCYIDLMRECWDSDPSKRPTIIILENTISTWLRLSEYHEFNDKREANIDNKLRNDMNETVEADKTLVEKQINTSITSITHPSACYTSRSLAEMLSQNSECLGCIIKDF
jgi:serine/threonine protein kinase